jgi:hypothetical protein
MVLLRSYGAYIGFPVQLLDQLKHIQVEAHADDVGATPRSLYWDERRSVRLPKRAPGSKSLPPNFWLSRGVTTIRSMPGAGTYAVTGRGSAGQSADDRRFRPPVRRDQLLRDLERRCAVPGAHRRRHHTQLLPREALRFSLSRNLFFARST